MSTIPTFDAKGTVQNVKRRAYAVLPWLPSFRCNACGTLCDPGWTWDRAQAAFNADEYGNNGEAPTWDCPNEECGKKWRREEVSALTFDMWDR